jgi:hypothetical protein
MEFDIARELQKPVYVFLSAEPSVRQAPKPDEQTEDAEATALQRAHRDAVQKTNHLYYFFKDQAELCKLVAEIPPVQAAGFKADISRIVKYAPTELIGREAETAVLDDAWLKVRRAESLRPHVLTFVALGGEGKTSLVAKWAASLAHQDWPGCDAVFAWSFYSQGTREQTAASSDLFLADALTFFGDAAMASSAQGAFDKGRRLAQLVGERRALLILDGLEPLQYAPTSPTPGELKDQGLAALLKGLAANSRGLCVVTTRYSIPDLRAFLGKTVQEEELLRLSTEAGVALLQSLGVKGSLRKTIPSADAQTSGSPLWNEFEKLVEDVKGHALTLNLLGGYLRDAHAGDIRQRDLIKLEEADAEEQGGHAFRVMDAYVKSFESGGKTAEDQAKGRRALALLQLLGLFDRPATADCLKALWQAPAIAGLTEPLIGISEAQRNLSLKRLEDAKLLTVNRDAAGTLLSLDAHPLLREYFAARVRSTGFSRSAANGPPKGGTTNATSEAWRAAHQRLYEHLCATTKEGDQPTLEDLQPLYQAVAHGCQAGLQKEAFIVLDQRIGQSNEKYPARKLGAFGSELGGVVCFFDQPWNRISLALPESLQAWLLNEASICLRALGRLNESLEPVRAGIKNYVKQENWYYAGVLASNLSELEITLGELNDAMDDAKQSVTYADRSSDAFQRMARRTNQADSLHQTGRRTEAEACFREAERMQVKRQPAYRLLYGLAGIWYCDLLLAKVERAAWQMMNAKHGMRNAELIETCRSVSQRATQTLKWAQQTRGASLLDIALNQLTLGRAALYGAILEPSEIQNSQSEIDAAVSGLYRYADATHIPSGLLTRAWLRSLTGACAGPESAQSDLDEAWEIAERGPMKLHMADIHLYRARLFFREPSYPWKSPQDDLAAAEKLINDCGYHRRDEELADARQAILG